MEIEPGASRGGRREEGIADEGEKELWEDVIRNVL